MMADIPRRKPMPSGYSPQPNVYAHSRSRTTSSNIFPTIQYPPQQQPQQYNMQIQSYNSRRTPSQGTFSTVASSGNGPLPIRQGSQDLRRSTSSRSGGGSPTSYVALMRKQKATVWCDRAQHEDPRLVAAQKAAKIRAAREVTGAGRTSTSGSGGLASSGRVTAKIRHGGKAGLVGYSPGDLVGGLGGVPMRLSASEVEGNDSDDDADSGRGPYVHHRRTGSGRSSIGSGRRGLTYSRQSNASSVAGKWSSGHSPPDSLSDLIEAGETPVPGVHQKTQDYFTATDNGTRDGSQSVGSGSSGERADHVGELDSKDAARLASNSLLISTVTREKSVRNPEELRRRGSVDERDRTMTMSHGRLYIANPDTDSD
ncbi:hypothetical protein B0O99DRAFT_654424 [Bisporella sp. PMI_857]|nr:hypothetical protein B0O99DRAFT_654424 [Bisporella sp. PMI_857]